MKNDEFGDRMKALEGEYTSTRIPSDQYLCVRIDGKTFSKFSKGFEKPFDTRMTEAMVETTKFLVEQTHANIGYTQSDEITLIYSVGEKASEHIYGGKVSKINSILASIATAKFNEVIPTDKLAFFDCRAWGVSTSVEASNVLLWRVQDARKNSVSAMFRWTLGSKKMHGLDQAQMKATMFEEGHDWSVLADNCKYGTYIKRVPRLVEIDPETLAKIPLDKRPEDGMVIRNMLESVEYGYFGDLSLDQRVNAIER